MIQEKRLHQIIDELAIHLKVMCPLSWSPGMGKHYYFESLGGYSMYLNTYNDEFFVTLPDNDGVFKIPKRASVVLLFSLISISEKNGTLVVPPNEQLSFKSLLQELKNSKLRLEKDFEVILICDHVNTEDMRAIDAHVMSKYGMHLKTFVIKEGKAYTFTI
jgi:hypothetical protein